MSHRKRKHEKRADIDKYKEVRSSRRPELSCSESDESQHKKPKTHHKYSKKDKRRDDSDIENCDDGDSYKKSKKSKRRDISNEEVTGKRNKYEKSKYKEKNYENSPETNSVQEKRYGKWADDDKDKEVYSSSREEFNYRNESQKKRSRDKHKRSEKRTDDYDTENLKYSRSEKRTDDYDTENLKSSRSEKRIDDYDTENLKYNRSEKRIDDYETENDKYRRSEKRTDDTENVKYRRSKKRAVDYDTESDNHRRSEKRIDGYDTENNQYRSEKRIKVYELEEDDDAESYDERKKSNKIDWSYERNDKRQSKPEKNKYSKEDIYKNSSRIDSAQDKKSYFSSRYKKPQEYVDLDDPNKKEDENTEKETISNDKSEDKEKNSKKSDIEPLSKKEKIGNINTRTGGAYIPPARLRMMQESIQDKSSEAYQRIAWEALKKTIIGMTNKVNNSNISQIVVELFKENIIRGRGVLARAVMQAQGASPTFTRVYAALVAIINTKFPEIGELILKRLIIQYKRGFRRNDKTVCLTAARFLAHLLNQEVAHEVLILEIVTHLLENPTDDSVEVAICLLKECGKKLTQLTPRGMRAISSRVREVLHEGSVDPRTRYMIEVFFAVQKDGFKEFEIIPPELDLVEEEDKFTHLITLDEAVDAQDMLNVFKLDPDYLENEEKYKAVVKEILGDSDEEESGAESDSEGEEGEDDDEEEKKESQQIVDMTETNIVCLRRKIYLTIQSSLDFEECAHKLLKLELKPGQILEMCYMILDCCAQQRTYEKFFGLLAQRFCQLNKIYVEPFTEIFQNSYKTIHRLETNKLRNVAKFFAHLLFTDAISWTVLSIIKLNEDDTSSSSRIFIKILFQELCEYLGLAKLNERVKDVTLQEAFEGLFPRDLPHNTRFAINFFTSIGLGGLTDELREHLKNMQKTPMPPVVQEKVSSPSASSSSSSSSSTSSSSSSSSSDSE